MDQGPTHQSEEAGVMSIHSYTQEGQLDLPHRLSDQMDTLLLTAVTLRCRGKSLLVVVIFVSFL